MARRRRKARATALLGQGLATESRLASLIQQPLRGPQPQRADTRVERGAPNQVWVADITYIPTDEGWLFLAAISLASSPPRRHNSRNRRERVNFISPPKAQFP
mgnify:CR=1 FL=1